MQLLGTLRGCGLGRSPMREIWPLYRCPTTRLRVQGWAVGGPTPPGEQSYEAVNCPACGGVHLVNPKTDKTAADHDENSN